MDEKQEKIFQGPKVKQNIFRDQKQNNIMFQGPKTYLSQN